MEDKEGKDEDTIYLSTLDNDNLKAEYTHVKVGQEKYGGWDNNGVKAYHNYRKAVKHARKSNRNEKWEKEALKILREDKGILGKTFDDQRALTGKKKRKKDTLSLDNCVPDLFALDDDNEEEEFVAFTE